MLAATYLISIILGCSFQSVIKKEYSKKCKSKGIFLFGALTALSATAFFLMTSGGVHFRAGLFPYALLFAVAYASATVGEVIAVTSGPLSITTLIISFSLMLPTFYGLLFLKETVGRGFLPGLALLAVSLLLIRSKGAADMPITGKWIVSLTIAFVGNGFCSIAQKLQQVKFEGEGKNEFMILALLIVALMLFSVALFRERSEMGFCFKKGWFFPLANGVGNGMVNLFVMLLFDLMPSSVMFPLISAGQIVFTSLAAWLLFRERLSRAQIGGLVTGILAVVFLNI